MKIFTPHLNGMGVELDAVQEMFQEAAHQNLGLGECEARSSLGDRSEVTNLLETAEEEGSEDCFGVNIVGVSPVRVSTEVEQSPVVV